MTCYYVDFDIPWGKYVSQQRTTPHKADACCNLSNPEHNFVPESSVVKGFVPFLNKWTNTPNADYELCVLCKRMVKAVYGAWQVLIEVFPLVELIL